MRTLICIMMFLYAWAVAGQEYELVWKDDFRGKDLDAAYWSEISRGTADWRKYMSSEEGLCELKNGKLVLKAVVNDGLAPDDTASFLTGGVYTKDKFSVGYGKVEVRVKLQGAVSVWPAIWMLPETGKWPDGGEIDIMERLNHDKFVYQTVHSNYTQVLKRKDDPRNHVTSPIRPDRFNVFGVEILPDRIIFSVNGKDTMAYPRIESDEFAREVQFPFGTPFYILMDMQIGGAWVGPPDGSGLPVKMMIDWVKVYSLK